VAPTPTGGAVLGTSTTTPAPNTGADVPIGLGALLIVGGLGLVAARRSRKSDLY
jgi:LPXTG-motif cell wall-anchored protein